MTAAERVRLGTSLQAVLEMAGVQLKQPERDLRAQVEALLTDAAHLPGCVESPRIGCSCLVGRLQSAIARPYNCDDCDDTGTHQVTGQTCTSCPMGGVR